VIWGRARKYTKRVTLLKCENKKAIPPEAFLQKSEFSAKVCARTGRVLESALSNHIAGASSMLDICYTQRYKHACATPKQHTRGAANKRSKHAKRNRTPRTTRRQSCRHARRVARQPKCGRNMRYHTPRQTCERARHHACKGLLPARDLQHASRWRPAACESGALVFQNSVYDHFKQYKCKHHKYNCPTLNIEMYA
jgi:hypothetical protein